MITTHESTKSSGDQAVRQAAASAKWAILAEIASRVISPFVFLVLARLLTKKDYGVIATAMMAISFVQMFWDAGLSKALVQIRADAGRAANVVFWMNIGLAMAMYVGLLCSADAVGRFFNSPDSVPVLRVLAIQVIIGSFGSVHQALLVRQLDFRKLFWVKLLTAGVPGLFSIPVALLGGGVWALVVGALAGQTTSVLMLWIRSPWRPHFAFDKAIASKLFKFAIWSLGESLAAWFLVWGDSAIVGRFLGVDDLGAYRTGVMAVTMLFGVMLNPFLPVLFSTFSRIQNSPEVVASAYRTANRVIVAVALPIGFGLVVFGPTLESAVFGTKWLGLGFVIQIIGFKEALSWTVSLNGEVYRAVGRPDLNSKLMAWFCVAYLPVYYLFANQGLQAFTVARLAIAIPTVPVHFFLARAVMGIPFSAMWRDYKNLLFAAGCLAAVAEPVVWGLGLIFRSPWIPLLVAGILGSAAYAACLWRLERGFVLETMQLILPKLRKEPGKQPLS